MKTIKNYTSFVNENIKEFVDVELDQDVIDYYLEIVEKGVSREEALQQVASDFGIAGEAVAIIVDEAGIKESVEVEEEEEEEVIEESIEESDETDESEEVIDESEESEESNEDEEINEASDEDEYLTPKQKKLPEGLKKGIIAKMKKSGKKAGDKKEDKKEDKEDKKNDKKDDKKDESSKSDEDKYLSAKQKKLPEGLKKAIIKKAKAKK